MVLEQFLRKCFGLRAHQQDSSIKELVFIVEGIKAEVHHIDYDPEEDKIVVMLHSE